MDKIDKDINTFEGKYVLEIRNGQLEIGYFYNKGILYIYPKFVNITNTHFILSEVFTSVAQFIINYQKTHIVNFIIIGLINSKVKKFAKIFIDKHKDKHLFNPSKVRFVVWKPSMDVVR